MLQFFSKEMEELYLTFISTSVLLLSFSKKKRCGFSLRVDLYSEIHLGCFRKIIHLTEKQISSCNN